MERNNWFLVATHLILKKDNKILLYKRKWGKQDWYYNLIAGHLDWNETPVEATIREANEEAWIIINKNDLVFSSVAYSINWKWQEIIQFYFICNKWEWEIKNNEMDRCYEMKFFPINNLPNNTTPYIKNAINDYLNNISYNEYN